MPQRRDSQQTLVNDDPNAVPGAKPNNPQMDKIKRTQAEIDNVTKQLAENIEAMQERGERLDVLQQKSGEFLCCSDGAG